MMGEVRRLGTESAATAAKRNRYTTEWLWYHRTNGIQWEAYPDAAKSRVGANVHAAPNADCLCSNSLELAYLRNPEGQWQFDDDDKTMFIVDFKTMIIRNLTTRLLSRVRRRPELYRPANELSAALPKGSDAYPKHWDMDAFQSESEDYVLVRVRSSGPTANEYMEVAKIFGKTMPDVQLKSVKRIQNRDLWESFDTFRSRMNRKRSTPATEMSLFHGTREQYVEAICQQGFDWRMCGTSVGTKWGKGSYFARDAHYSKSYTDCKKMFLVKVLNAFVNH
jgi:poly [ADP-ribose] polymerase 7/11/12/13